MTLESRSKISGSSVLSKAPGFVDPNNPEEKSKAPAPESDDKTEIESGVETDEEGPYDGLAEEAKRKPVEAKSDQRYPMLSFSNTDMAFIGDTLIAGNYHGFNLYDIANGGLLSSSARSLPRWSG